MLFFSVPLKNKSAIWLVCLQITRTLDFLYAKHVLNISKSEGHKILPVI